ncbi:site-specific integrase [Tabrizicola sp. J26]|uniref:site-specific integrase n=1 Tax=Alitabrizicola rongguiensis TaxID=2909234 RepID=UPI001F342FE9|nr:site-specific integrase [Tabrizicola rongguiensis]MCF1709454.1 site-specific integrase [Tabrizicola rongguiensis]
MTKSENNQKADGGQYIATLRDLYDALGKVGLPSSQRAELRSAIRRLDHLVGHGLMDLPADLPLLMARLNQVTPATAGMTPGSLANLRSRVRRAFRCFNDRVFSVRRIAPSSEWRLLLDTVGPKLRLGLTRFARFATLKQCQPVNVDDTLADQFQDYLAEAGLVTKPRAMLLDLVRNWNRVATKFPCLGLRELSAPAGKRKPYWAAQSLWPEQLVKDIDAFLVYLAEPPIFAKAKQPALSASTVAQYRVSLTTVLSARVAQGAPIASFTSLKALATAENTRRALEFLHERRGNRVTRDFSTIAARCQKAADWCGATTSELAAFDALLGSITMHTEELPTMTPKNARLLDRLDEQRFRDLLVTLPLRLMAKARSNKSARLALCDARCAVVIELLLTCSMRRGNLATLKLDENIKRIRNQNGDVWVIEFGSHHVKNKIDLRYELPPESGDLLKEYLRDWRPLITSTPNSWLFPNSAGGPMDMKLISSSIATKAKAELGVPITAHQFRHLAASMFVMENPEKIGVASDHLGHKSVDTTRRFYVRNQQRNATRLYQEKLGLDRKRALERSPTKSLRRKLKRRAPDDGDLL